ncbi:MAG: 2OG-Fe(II) oxygenase [Rubrivivax sp.]|nr:MAG: 2OG-Fe(II) oxygenase [Rubrivivax sp.]
MESAASTARTTSARPPADIVFDHDFISVYQGLDAALCSSVIEQFERDARKSRGQVGARGATGVDAGLKSSWDLEIANEGAWQPLFQHLHAQIQACLQHYLSRSPVLQSLPLQATGYKIQMYPRGEGYFRWHADAIGGDAGDRLVAMVLYLNDVEEGGETEFFHQGLKIAPRAGQLVLFPAGWNYLHCGHVPRSSGKYIVSTFVRLTRQG